MSELGFELSAHIDYDVGGAPKRDIHPLIKAFATDSAVMSVKGMASGQRVKQSTQVRTYVYPLDGGSGLTMSMWMTLKRASGLNWS